MLVKVWQFMDRHHQTILTLVYYNFLIQSYELFKFRIWPPHDHVSSYGKFHLIRSTGILKPGLKPKPGDVYTIFVVTHNHVFQYLKNWTSAV